MSYIKIATREKLEAADIMVAHPEVSFPNRGWSDEDLAPYGYAELHFPVEHPFPDTYEKLIEVSPELLDGKWYIQFAVVAMTDEEIAQKNLEIEHSIIVRTQDRLDAFAQTRGYDGILSLSTYATSPTEKFRIEGQYGVEARDATWAKLYEIMEEVKVGARPMPTGYEDPVDELPELNWPE